MLMGSRPFLDNDYLPTMEFNLTSVTGIKRCLACMFNLTTMIKVKPFSTFKYVYSSLNICVEPKCNVLTVLL